MKRGEVWLVNFDPQIASRFIRRVGQLSEAEMEDLSRAVVDLFDLI